MYNAPKEVAKALRSTCLLLVAALLIAAPVAGFAQPAPKGTPSPDEVVRTPKTRRAEPPPRVIELEGDEIVGKVPKPQVFYLLGRSESHYRGLRVRRSFVRQIVESLKRNPL